jgi:hypothetical protein
VQYAADAGFCLATTRDKPAFGSALKDDAQERIVLPLMQMLYL